LNAQEILRWLVQRFGLLLLLTLIGGIAGAIFTAVKAPTYTAKAYVVAIGSQGDSTAALGFAQAYGRIATSGPVLAFAGARLGSNRTGLAQVTSSTSPDAPVIQVTSSGTSAQHAADLANAVADALADYGSTRRNDTNVSLAVLAPATKPTRPSSPRPPMEVVIGAAAGLLIGGLALLAGVGRPSDGTKVATEEADTYPTKHEVAEVEEPARTERYLGVARASYPPPKSITVSDRAQTGLPSAGRARTAKR